MNRKYLRKKVHKEQQENGAKVDRMVDSFSYNLRQLVMLCEVVLNIPDNEERYNLKLNINERADQIIKAIAYLKQDIKK